MHSKKYLMKHFMTLAYKYIRKYSWRVFNEFNVRKIALTTYKSCVGKIIGYIHIHIHHHIYQSEWTKHKHIHNMWVRDWRRALISFWVSLSISLSLLSCVLIEFTWFDCRRSTVVFMSSSGLKFAGLTFRDKKRRNENKMVGKKNTQNYFKSSDKDSRWPEMNFFNHCYIKNSCSIFFCCFFINSTFLLKIRLIRLWFLWVFNGISWI